MHPDVLSPKKEVSWLTLRRFRGKLVETALLYSSVDRCEGGGVGGGGGGGGGGKQGAELAQPILFSFHLPSNVNQSLL